MGWRPALTGGLHFGSFPAVNQVIDAEVVGQILHRCVIVHSAVVRVHGRD